MAVRLDFTKHSIVAVCDRCPFWRVIALNRAEAWRHAAAHERAVHPGNDQQAQKAYQKLRQRRSQ